MAFDRDSPLAIGWRPSIGRMMLGVIIVAMFLTEETRIVLVGLTYVLYPIVIGWLVATKRHVRIAHERPGSWRLAKNAVATVIVGWPLAFVITDTLEGYDSVPVFLTIAKVLVFTPVALASVVAWLLIPLPRMERRHS